MTVGWVGVVASTVLIVVAIGLSLWRRLRVERSILWASARAAVQLLAVGAVFNLIFESASATLWGVLWVVGMTVVSAEVVVRRTPDIPAVRPAAYISLAGSLAISLGLLFGLTVFDFEPVTLVVLAGITLGNTMPSAVLAVDTASKAFTEAPGRIEAALALGLSTDQVARLVTPEAVRTALIPQIERTKVVGLIALPGAMTGLLLAGVDAVSAVLVQLVIMYLILGSVAIVVVVVVTTIGLRGFSPDQRLADWTIGGSKSREMHR